MLIAHYMVMLVEGWGMFRAPVPSETVTQSFICCFLSRALSNNCGESSVFLVLCSVIALLEVDPKTVFSFFVLLLRMFDIHVKSWPLLLTQRNSLRETLFLELLLACLWLSLPWLYFPPQLLTHPLPLPVLGSGHLSALVIEISDDLCVNYAVIWSQTLGLHWTGDRYHAFLSLPLTYWLWSQVSPAIWGNFKPCFPVLDADLCPVFCGLPPYV